MQKLVINGGKKLSGEVTIGGAKNSTVALIPAAILSDTPVVLDSVPQIRDVNNLRSILLDMNVTSEVKNDVLKIDPTKIHFAELPSGKVSSLRASYYFMGAMLGRFGKAVVGFPGGDDIGPRPIDQHIKGFEALGAHVENKQGQIIITSPADGLKGAKIFLDMVSVGATINVILAAVKAKGTTVIENAAKEPEIIDLATFLNNMGAIIRGVGTETIRIEGVDQLRSNNSHTIIPDRIEAGTYLSLAAANGGDILINNIISEHLDAFIAKLDEMNVNLEIGEDSIYVKPSPDIRAVNIKTMPYPGFATDLQQPITPLLLQAQGEAMIIDTIYPKRIKHISELQKMGGDISSENDLIFVHGGSQLSGATVSAEEIRAGACLMIAGLLAHGTTVIENAENILRGYDRVVWKLHQLQADVELVGEDDLK
ncbi:UDP-N-acetylglucosamine 1-carboxyvinyltransferase [Companilactobacillus mishanensis]|uniref:UDP-N-acetylglucosamine 1-carboxyvinyltransferase n=1 Tax=Companilactobacillus mishanensis TaxID=2486008 RepID=A0A5P0ZH16_9LACO|nr:UDP-N-acetylglucosamine 1-carboxyvinyltransferase [Companilactobacillus mishanensis]MQS44961.1 UDP-N-acetylglucosamine 1-carboxyvinyltransferase [Companilactobacillus mishanensis]MQS52360.1 UDP-N-acetylglucosamine 1-carboxyvinyltransferase [Companilactobacillus mishanensis]MQS89476.1 UDP-N-acetylglucosamine 1-carboxyvinyltransferase [Companilactobacillus mishanensis]